MGGHAAAAGGGGAMGQCFSCVENGTVALVTQCGAFKGIAGPGFNCIWCCLGENVQAYLNLRQQQLNVELETKTKDDVSVKVVVSVQYLISNDKDFSENGSYYKAYYKLNDPELQIRSYVLNVVRSAIPKISLDGVFESKDEIAEKVRMDLSSSMSQFGYVIVNTLVTDIEPAAQVKAAMNEINAATRMRKVAIEKADAEAKYLAGTGIMRQRQAIVNGLRESVKVFSEEVKDVTSKDVMDMMILTQYFDVLKDLGSGAKSSAAFIPHSPAGVSDVSGAVRNGVLQARQV